MIPQYYTGRPAPEATAPGAPTDPAGGGTNPGGGWGGWGGGNVHPFFQALMQLFSGLGLGGPRGGSGSAPPQGDWIKNYIAKVESGYKPGWNQYSGPGRSPEWYAQRRAQDQAWWAKENARLANPANWSQAGTWGPVDNTVGSPTFGKKSFIPAPSQTDRAIAPALQPNTTGNPNMIKGRFGEPIFLDMPPNQNPDNRPMPDFGKEQLTFHNDPGSYSQPLQPVDPEITRARMF